MLEEVRSVEVRLVEVRKNERLLRPPLIADLDALTKEFEMLWVGH
jgi:hypothetical protein